MSEETKIIIEKLTSIDEKVNRLDEKVNRLDEKVSELDKKVNLLDKRVNHLEDKVSILDENVKDIQLTLENVTNRNINIIGEGHADLSRKLDEALKVENEKELLMLRVNILENDMRQVKEKVFASA